MQHKEHVSSTEKHIIYRHNFSRYDVMAYKRKWRRPPLPALPEVIVNAFSNGCERLPNFDWLIISLSVKWNSSAISRRFYHIQTKRYSFHTLINRHYTSHFSVCTD